MRTMSDLCRLQPGVDQAVMPGPRRPGSCGGPPGKGGTDRRDASDLTQARTFRSPDTGCIRLTHRQAGSGRGAK